MDDGRLSRLRRGRGLRDGRAPTDLKRTPPAPHQPPGPPPNPPDRPALSTFCLRDSQDGENLKRKILASEEETGDGEAKRRYSQRAPGGAGVEGRASVAMRS